MYLFGPGLLWGTPLTDASGAAIAVPTPLLFGTLQNTEFDFKFEIKQLHGQNQFAVAVGRGKASVNGSRKTCVVKKRDNVTVVKSAPPSMIFCCTEPTTGISPAIEVPTFVPK